MCATPVCWMTACGNVQAPPCAAGQFAVNVVLTVGEVDVVLHNNGPRCRFSGQHPVFISSALRATRPPDARGVVPPDASFVQPYRADQGSPCPANLSGRYDLDVSIEGTTVRLNTATSRAQAPEIDACIRLDAQTPHLR